MTKTSTPAHWLAALDEAARTGWVVKATTRTALIRRGWIEARHEGEPVAVGFLPLTVYYVTDEGSRIRSNGADDL